MIGEEMSGVAIHADTENGRTDWPSDPAGLRYERAPVPNVVAEAVSAYMKRRNLVYAGFDFLVTPDDQWVMLEGVVHLLDQLSSELRSVQGLAERGVVLGSLGLVILGRSS